MDMYEQITPFSTLTTKLALLTLIAFGLSGCGQIYPTEPIQIPQGTSPLGYLGAPVGRTATFAVSAVCLFPAIRQQGQMPTPLLSQQGGAPLFVCGYGSDEQILSQLSIQGGPTVSAVYSANAMDQATFSDCLMGSNFKRCTVPYSVRSLTKSS
jgi:hypothetical protein